MDQAFRIMSTESAQLHVREHLDKQMDKIYGKFTDWKFEGLISSRDAQLHVNALSLPSLTVKKRNVVFPVSHPAHGQSQPHQQSTPPFVRTESLLWNLVNTMELDAPCRGLKTTAFKSLIITVSEIFKREACMQFERTINKSSFNLLQHQCTRLKNAVIRFKNRDEKRIEVISICSDLLVLSHQLHFELLQSDSKQNSQPAQQLQQSREVSSVKEDDDSLNLTTTDNSIVTSEGSSPTNESAGLDGEPATIMVVDEYLPNVQNAMVTGEAVSPVSNVSNSARTTNYSVSFEAASKTFGKVWSWVTKTDAKSTAKATAIRFPRWPSLDHEIAEQLHYDYQRHPSRLKRETEKQIDLEIGSQRD